MRLLITGANGQLGIDVTQQAQARGFDVYAFNKEELDITSYEQVEEILDKTKPDGIIHCAAYTKVDLAETKMDMAYDVNVNGTRNLTILAEKIGAKFCYVSTDYVFDGTGNRPYQEYDRPNPISIYGKSKLGGEEVTKTLNSKYFIVRTSWVYGHGGSNFVKTMLRLSQERDQISVVNDQIGSPTYTVDLAYFLLDLIETNKFGVYHASNSGQCTWYEFAKAIFEEAQVDIKLNPITTSEFPTAATRPKYSLLDNIAIKTNGFQPLRHWQEALKDYFSQ